VRYEHITGAQWVEEASKAPGNPFLIQHASAVAEMHALGQTAGTNNVVEKIIGRKPQTVAEFVEKHRAAFE
jgi:NAD(P)H dehydrogenase (quinone)